jgi:acyl-coenzyme A thioesterase PaaI-like protein
VTDPPRFGEQPLTQTTQAAAALRRLTGLLLSLENDHPAVDDMLSRFPRWEAELSAAAPADDSPRIGEDPDGRRRVYLDHASYIGAYNPCFPEYRFAVMSGDDASGTVTFPLVYEGPPGLVHGGVSALILDQLLGEAASAGGRPGMTGTLTIVYKHGTPLGPLRGEARIASTEGVKAVVRGRLLTRPADGSEPVLCVEAEGIFILPRWAREAMAAADREHVGDA